MPLASAVASLFTALALAASPAEPAPTLELAPAHARPGDAVLVVVHGGAAAPTGTLAGRPLAFWKGADGWLAMAALPIEQRLGQVTAAVSAGGTTLTAHLEVVEPGFRTSSRTLTMAPALVEPPDSVKARMAADRTAFAQAYDQPFTAPLFAQGFDWPRNAPTSGRYGDARILNGKKDTIHYGLDLTGPRGSPVYAANDGVVAIARDAYLSGNTVILWHGGGIYTAYFHMDRMQVRSGDRVKRGQRLGDLGSTGRSTGPHLHWGVKVAGLYVDPESLLAIDFARASAAERAPAPATPEEPAPVPEAVAPAGGAAAAVPAAAPSP